MVYDGGGGYPLVDDQVGHVLDDIHGGHVDHDLGVRSMLSRVQNVDVSIGQGR